MEQLDRRNWMKLLPVLSASRPSAAQTPAAAPQRVNKHMLHNALQLIGFECTEAQESMMLPGINRALSGYDDLRKLNVTLDTEPPMRFSPTTPLTTAPTFPPTHEQPNS